MKGDYNNECNRTACSNENATFYNSSTRKHYCSSCANKINYWSELDHGVTLCKIPECTLDDKGACECDYRETCDEFKRY